MDREVRFTDLFCMPERSNIFSDANNLLEDFYIADNSPNFRVTIRATHAGYLLNNRVYPGRGVRAGASSWVSKENGGTSGYDKPFLKHHDAKSEPIGRVDSQKFVQLWDDKKFNNDWKNPDHGTSPGSGYIVISGIISDKDSQQKILDGRYKTVSTGQTSNKAYCSICGYDWLHDAKDDEEMCDHKPGKVYQVDGVKYKAYLVTGNMKYLECSFVNHPANELAGILSADFDSSLVPKSNEEKIQVVTADTMGGICSIALADSEGRVTELIKSAEEKDELPYSSNNVKRSVRISVPEGYDLNSKQSEPAIDGPLDSSAFKNSLLARSLEGDFDKDTIDEIDVDVRESLRHDAIKEFADRLISLSLSKTKCLPDSEDNVIINESVDSENRKDTKNPMSDNSKVKDNEVEAKSDPEIAEPTDLKDKVVSVLETALADSQIKSAELEAELAKAKQLYDTKVSEYNCLMDQNAVLNEEFKKQLSSQLVTMQMQLQKPQVKSITDNESFSDAVINVASRSIESLRDSIEDLVPELANSFKSKGLPVFVKDRTEEKPPVVKSTKEESVITDKQEQLDPRDQI